MALNASDFAAYARRSAMDAVGIKADTEILNVINGAAYLLASERPYPWLKRRGFLNFVAEYDTGTITLTLNSAVVTGAGTTFPSLTAPFKLYVKGRVFEVLTRDSATQLTLAANWGEATEAGLEYVVFKDDYALPDNLLTFGHILPGQAWASGMAYTDPEEFWVRQNDVPISQSYPDIYTVHSNYLAVWPWPSEARSIAYTYYAQPTPITSISSGTLDWPVAHKLILEAAIDVMVARRFGKCIVGDFNAAMGILKLILGWVDFDQRGGSHLPSMSELTLGTRMTGRPPPWKTLSA